MNESMVYSVVNFGRNGHKQIPSKKYIQCNEEVEWEWSTN